MSADLVRFPATIERRLGLSERYRGRYLMAAAGRRPGGYWERTNPFPLASTTTLMARMMSKPRPASSGSSRRVSALVRWYVRASGETPSASSVPQVSVMVGIGERSMAQ
jgi:hypothetical protein